MATSYGTATRGEGGDFPIPDVEDGLYRAMIKDVRDGTGSWDGKTYQQYLVEWELLDDEGRPYGDEEITLLQFVRIPEALVNEGVLYEESNLFLLMEALGCDMEEIVVEPADWQGAEARILVENKTVQSGKNAGQVRPRITKVKALAKQAPAKKAPTKRAPVKRAAREDEDF